MKPADHERDWKIAAYGIARYGAAGMILRPIFDRLLDGLSHRINARAVAMLVGGLFLAFVATGWLDAYHRENIVAEGRYSQSETQSHSWRYGDDGLYVGAADWSLHLWWRTIGTLSGSGLVLSGLISGIALWRKHLRDEGRAVFGEGNLEFEDFMRQPSVAERDWEDLKDDWLLSGVPEQPRPDGQTSAARPRFGRKHL